MLKLLEWKFELGQPLPVCPLIQDDRRYFPDAVVRELLQYLEANKTNYQHLPPTPIQIRMGPQNSNAEIIYGVGNLVVPGYGSYTFKTATVEFLFREKRKGPILAKYRFLAARTPEHREILGPQITTVDRDGLIQPV